MLCSVVKNARSFCALAAPCVLYITEQSTTQASLFVKGKWNLAQRCKKSPKIGITAILDLFAENAYIP